MKSFLSKKKMLIDKVAIKIRIIEFFKMLPYWLLCCAILYLVKYLFEFVNLSVYKEFIEIIIIPLLLSIFVSLIFLFINIYNKRVLWADKKISIYRDLLEIFSRIIVSMHRDFDNPIEAPLFRGYLPLNEAEQRLSELYNFAKEKNHL